MDEDGFFKRSSLNMGNNIVNVWDGKDFIRKYLLYWNAVANASGCIFRKEAAQSVDHQYEKYRGSGDWLFWIEMAELGNVCFDHRAMNFFRQHGDNTTNKLIYNGTNMLDDYEVFSYMERKRLINHKEAFRRTYRQLYRIKTSTFKSGDIKRQILKKWGYNFFYGIFLLPYSIYASFKKRLGVPL